MIPKVLVTVGTRPEAIKLAPVVRALEAHGGFAVRLVFTGQHRELLDQMATFFDLRADRDLAVMQAGQTLPELTARLMRGVDAVLADEAPTVVLTQGDTTTVLVTALACYYRRIPVGHVEAGLRTDDLFSPFPEEGNRRLASVLTAHHFAPTRESAENLRREGVPDVRIHVTGNTVVDALQQIVTRDLPLPVPLPGDGPVVLVTMHRRENFGAPLRGLLGALRTLCVERPELTVVYPVHPNPNVLGPAHEVLGDLPNARLLAPVGYGEFIALMKRATIALTDSGGVQEEGPSIGLPILVLRDTTERPEGIAAGVARLCGTDPARVLAEARRLLDDPAARAAMRGATNPYGDGHAAERIVRVLADAYC